MLSAYYQMIDLLDILKNHFNNECTVPICKDDMKFGMNTKVVDEIPNFFPTETFFSLLVFP